ncbi:acetylglutamate kinase [Ethanoligenens sp.]|uniref:acetylglutamate kinase n=1 Tax=Ethanoligenens sp. TaxID=2099655 RepID=UPI0039E7A07E
MGISEHETAQVLVHALPYIQQYNNKTIVVKFGGNAMVSGELKDAVMTDLVLLSLVGIRVVLVHGGGPEITDMLDKIGKESLFVGGLRYTDHETMDIVQMVLGGKVNKDLVLSLQRKGGRAIGLCGLDGGMIEAERLFEDGVDLGQVGQVSNVDVTPINDALGNGYIPVVATMGAGQDGKVYNINADTAAARIAAALGAEKLILLTDIRGLLRNKDDDSTLIPVVNVSEVPNLIRQGIISGGMIPKIDCCVEAVRRGVNRAHIIDGRRTHAILVEMFSDSGIGTMFL